MNTRVNSPIAHLGEFLYSDKNNILGNNSKEESQVMYEYNDS